MPIKFEMGSGNVFADLGIKNPEEALAKAELVRQIDRAIRRKKLTQKKAAALLDIDQPKISALLHGRFGGFSLERLIRFLNMLGADVRINIQPNRRSRKKGSLSITSAEPIAQYTHVK